MLIEHGSHLLVQILLVVVSVGFRMLATADTSELEQLLSTAVMDALNAAHLSVKEAAHYMRIDPEQLRRQLKNEPKQYLSLLKLLSLPFGFWLNFSPSLIAIVYRKRMQDMAETFAELRGNH
jgi:hypothetical protein